MRYPSTALFAMFLGTAALLGVNACSKGEARAPSTGASSAASSKSSASGKGKSSAPAASRSDAKPANVKVQRLASGTLTEFVLAHGVTKAMRKVSYSAEIAGRLEYLSADLGDRVRRGQVLARIDFQTLKAQADQARVRYDLARSTHERLARLKGEDLVSQQQIDEASSHMNEAQAQLAIAQANLAKSTVTSSHRGIVSAKHVERGEFVAPGTGLYEVVDYRTIIVEAQLAETQVSGIAKGAAAEVDIGALGKRFEGTVDTIIPTADRSSKTFTLRVEVDNPDLEILVGMSATVRMAARTHSDVIVVSQSAVVEEKDGRSVFVAHAGVADKRRVRLGPHEGDQVVLLEGVKPGEDLVVLGQRDLVDGQPIRVIR